LSIFVEVYYSIDDLDQDLISQWRSLESNALNPNAYLSPCFVIPAQKYLTEDQGIVIVVVYQALNSHIKMIGLAVFQIVLPTIKYPFTYLTTYNSTHSFLGGILLDKFQYINAAKSMFNHLKKINKWSVIQISEFKFDDAVSEINACLLKYGINWFKYKSINRCVLYPKQSGIRYIDKNISYKRLKDINRRRRNLNKIGDVSWCFITKKEITKNTIEDFLKLENSGWKGKCGTSLLSNNASKNFFIDITANFKKHNNIFFTEIKLNNEVIASTCNFISGNIGFAFKLSWNDDYSQYSIGYLNEIEFIVNAPTKLRHISFIDGGTEPGSFLDKLWVNNIELVTGVYSLNKFSYIYLKCVFLIKYLLNIIK